MAMTWAGASSSLGNFRWHSIVSRRSSPGERPRDNRGAHIRVMTWAWSWFSVKTIKTVRARTTSSWILQANSRSPTAKRLPRRPVPLLYSLLIRASDLSNERVRASSSSFSSSLLGRGRRPSSTPRFWFGPSAGAACSLSLRISSSYTVINKTARRSNKICQPVFHLSFSAYVSRSCGPRDL